MSTSALQVARTGLDAQAERMRIIANNLANVNTTAFQRDRAEFATLAYQTITAAGARSAGDNQYATGLNLGTGVRMTGTGRVTTQGSLATTSNPLDLAIEGQGYFQVLRPDGTIGYSRAGNFHLSAEGKVVTSDGMPWNAYSGLVYNPDIVGIMMFGGGGHGGRRGNDVWIYDITANQWRQQYAADPQTEYPYSVDDSGMTESQYCNFQTPCSPSSEWLPRGTTRTKRPTISFRPTAQARAGASIPSRGSLRGRAPMHRGPTSGVRASTRPTRRPAGAPTPSVRPRS